MTLRTNKFAAATAVAAAFCLLATPAAAVELPKPVAAKAYDGEGLNADRDRRGRRHRDDGDIDAGDVVAGVLVLGALAAIFSGGNSDRDRDNDRDYDYDPDPAPLRNEGAGYQAPANNGGYGSRGLGNAVDICVAELERDQGRVSGVDAASRFADGWHVSGTLENGAPFSCRIGNDGRVSGVEVGAYEAAYEAPADGAWSDDDYARARDRQGFAGYDLAKASR